MTDEERAEQDKIQAMAKTTTNACPKCNGYGWVWWNELKDYNGPAIESGQDDTQYSCDECGVRKMKELNISPMNMSEGQLRCYVSDLLSKIEESGCQIEAWHTAFGTSQLSHALARLEVAENKVKRLSNITSEAPDGWEFIPILVPVKHEYGETYLDGRALQMLDVAKIKGYVEENKKLKSILKEHGRHNADCDLVNYTPLGKPIPQAKCTCGFDEALGEKL